MPKPDPRTDLELIAAINAGDDSAFEPLYYRHRDWVVGVARRCTGNDDDALDVLQETFGYLIGKFPGFTLSSRLKTFLYPVVKNLSLTRLRERGRQSTGSKLDDLEAHGALPDSAGERADLAAALSGLPENQREVLLLRFVDDFSVAEIAKTLGIPEGTVKSRLHNAIHWLRNNPRVRSHFTA